MSKYSEPDLTQFANHTPRGPRSSRTPSPAPVCILKSDHWEKGWSGDGVEWPFPIIPRMGDTVRLEGTPIELRRVERVVLVTGVRGCWVEVYLASNILSESKL